MSVRGFRTSWCKAWFAKRIDEIWDEIFFRGAGFDGFFFVFYDNLVIGDFDYLGAGNDEFGVGEALHEWALDYDLLDYEIIGGECEV